MWSKKWKIGFLQPTVELKYGRLTWKGNGQIWSHPVWLIKQIDYVADEQVAYFQITLIEEDGLRFSVPKSKANRQLATEINHFLFAYKTQMKQVIESAVALY